MELSKHSRTSTNLATLYLTKMIYCASRDNHVTQGVLTYINDVMRV